MNEKITTPAPIATYTPILVAFGVLGDVRGELATEGMAQLSRINR